MTTDLRAPLPAPSTAPGSDLRLLLAAAAVSKLGTAVSSLALPLVAVLALHCSAGQVGLLAMLSTVAFLLVGLPAGAWVDRLPKRPVMVAADLARAVLYGSVPAAWLLDCLTFAQLALVVLLAGVATVFFDVAALSNLPAVVGRAGLTRANAHLVTVDALAQVGGRGAGGFLMALVSAPVAVLLDAFSYLGSAVLLLRIRRPEPVVLPRPAAGSGRGLAREVRDGLRFVLRDPLLRPIALAGACTNLSIQLCQTVLPVLFARSLHLSDGVLGVFFALGGVGVFLGSLLARPLARRLGAGRVLWLMGLAVAPLGILVALVDRGPLLWCAAGAWLLTTLKVGIDNVINVSFRQHATPDHLLGRMNATMRVLLTGALTVGAALAGLLATVISLRAALWAGALGLAVVWVPTYLSPLRGMRDLPGTADGR